MKMSDYQEYNPLDMGLLRSNMYSTWSKAMVEVMQHVVSAHYHAKKLKDEKTMERCNRLGEDILWVYGYWISNEHFDRQMAIHEHLAEQQQKQEKEKNYEN